eukprot:1990564-Ditylum_brightwellii.AAC.1
MALLLDPFNTTLDLSGKEDRKLFKADTKGPSDDLKITGEKEKFNDFRNRIRERIRKVRLMEALDILTKWESKADPKNPTKVINIFKATRDTKEVVEAHVDLVWADMAHKSATTQKYFKAEAHDAWLAIVGYLDTKVSTGDVYRRVAIQEGRQLQWLAVVDKLENAKLDDFRQDIKEFNTWFADKRNSIIRGVGKERYIEYKRCLFKTYHTAENKVFMLVTHQERRNWMMGKHKAGYLYSN